MKNRSGFTLVDLMVLVVLLLFAAAVIMPAVYRWSWSNSDKAACARNLHQIGLSMLKYAIDDARYLSFPRTIYVPGAPPSQFTAPNSPHPFNGPNTPSPNDVTAAVFLLLRTRDVKPADFVCPATNFVPFDAAPQSAQQYSNFTKTNQLSYSFHNRYPTTAARMNGIVNYDVDLPPDFPIAADINPGTPELTAVPVVPASRAMNSPNHGRAGQNVLYADIHVEWKDTPFVGLQGDNIYTFGPSPAQAHPNVKSPIGIMGSPVDGNDSVLLPVFDTSLPMPSSEYSAFTLLLVGVGVVIILGGVGTLLYFLLKKPNTPNTPPPLPMGA